MMALPLPRRRLLLLDEAGMRRQVVPGRLRLPNAAWRCGRPIGRPQWLLLQQQIKLVRCNCGICIV